MLFLALTSALQWWLHLWAVLVSPLHSASCFCSPLCAVQCVSHPEPFVPLLFMDVKGGAPRVEMGMYKSSPVAVRSKWRQTLAVHVIVFPSTLWSMQEKTHLKVSGLGEEINRNGLTEMSLSEGGRLCCYSGCCQDEPPEAGRVLRCLLQRGDAVRAASWQQCWLVVWSPEASGKTICLSDLFASEAVSMQVGKLILKCY